MTEIAARSGTTFGSLYRFFPSKEALANALLAQYAERALDRLAELAELAPTLTPAALADALVDFMMKLQAERSFAAALMEAGARRWREARGFPCGVSRQHKPDPHPRISRLRSTEGAGDDRSRPAHSERTGDSHAGETRRCAPAASRISRFAMPLSRLPRGRDAQRMKENETRVEPQFRHRTVKMAPFSSGCVRKDVICHQARGCGMVRRSFRHLGPFWQACCMAFAVFIALALLQAPARGDDLVKHPTLYRTTKVDGLSIFYREAGPSDAPTLLLLHGFPSSSRMFEPLFARLSDRYHLVAPDYPGFGHSDWPDPKAFAYTFDHIASVMDDFVQATGAVALHPLHAGLRRPGRFPHGARSILSGSRR